MPQLPLKFVFPFSVTGYWFNNLCLHQMERSLEAPEPFSSRSFITALLPNTLLFREYLFAGSYSFNNRVGGK